MDATNTLLAACAMTKISQPSCCPEQSFKTRTGLVGRPGTRPNRAWDRSGWRQKLARELVRENPVDLGPGAPGQTRVRPGQFFFYFHCH